MQRKLDNMGRIVIPIKIRRELKLDKEPLDFEIEVSNGQKQIVIKRAVCKCTICGSEEDITSVMGHNICKQCSENMKKFYTGKTV